jgi:carboxyl-terminal processing protease
MPEDNIHEVSRADILNSNGATLPQPGTAPVEYRMPKPMKIQLILGSIFLSVSFFLIGIVFTVLMINIPFDGGPLNAVQRPILSAVNIPPDAHRQWLNISQTFSLIDRYFYEPDKINHKEMTYAAAQAAANYLGDPFTQFVPPQRSKELSDNLSGQRVGIGILAQYNTEERNISIKEVFENSPAEKAGLKGDDIFWKVNSQLVTITGDSAKDLEALTSVLRGEKGTKVNLTVRRPSENNREIDFEITRDEFIRPSVTVKLLPEKIGYISINVFGNNTVKEFDQKVKKLIDDGATGLVLDLRNNGGGLVDTSKALLARFLNGGVAYYADIPSENVKYRAENVSSNNEGLQLYDIPLVVLVNKDSASASEITAGALRDRNRAPLIGQRTYGKGVAQYVLPLLDGSTARITFERWYTPAKIDISRLGLEPNIAVAQTQEDINAGKDPQLDRAMQFLLNKESIPPLNQ